VAVGDVAEESDALEERLNVAGVLRVHLHKAIGLDSADLNGKSDPCVPVQPRRTPPVGSPSVGLNPPPHMATPHDSPWAGTS